MTGICRHRHPERSRGIFTALRKSACMRRGKTMSWYCLTSGYERSAIKTLGYARNDDAREALSKLRGASDFYALHHHSSFLIRAELSNVIMGRHARGANPRPSLRESPFSSTIERNRESDLERRYHYAELRIHPAGRLCKKNYL